MNRVLLVFEDYGEMNDIQFALRKTGFDVVSISSEFSISEEILSFNPDIVIGGGKGPKVTTVGVGRRLKEMPRWHGKVILIFPAGYKPNAQDLLRVRMDMILEAPVESNRMIQVMAKLTDQDANELLEKLIRAVSAEKEEAAKNPNRVSTGAGTGPEAGSQTVFVTGGKKPEEVGWAYSGSKDIEELNKILGGTGQERDQEQVAKGVSDAAQGESAHVKRDAGEQGAAHVTSGSTDGVEANLVGSQKPVVESEQDQGATSLSTPAGQPEVFVSPEEVQKEFEKAQAAIKTRVEKYDQYLQGMSVDNSVSTVKRTDAKKRLKELRQTWDEKKLFSLDELRREFTNALFKKK